MGDNTSVTIPFASIDRKIASPLSKIDRPYPAKLTIREVTILQMFADGLNLKQISTELGNTEGTLKNALRTIRNKTGMDTTITAVVWALRHKVIE